jgi:hypothetical protein
MFRVFKLADSICTYINFLPDELAHLAFLNNLFIFSFLYLKSVFGFTLKEDGQLSGFESAVCFTWVFKTFIALKLCRLRI